MEINNFLEYQNKDREALSVEKILNNNKNKIELNKMLNVLKNAKTKSTDLEKKAGELVSEVNTIKEKYERVFKEIESISKTEVNALDLDKADSINEKTARLSLDLNFYERKLMSLAEQVNSTLNDFKKVKEVHSVARKRYAESKNLFDAEEKKHKPQLDKLKAEMKEIEKNLDKKFLTKYKSKRQDKIFPVLVPLRNDKNCGGCMMELSYADTAKIKKDGYIECENCRRIIYKA